MSDKPTVIEALSAAMTEVQAVGKDSRNIEQGYNYRGVDAVVKAVGPVLRKHGVLVLPEVLDASYRDVRTTKDKPARECTVRVRYRFYGPAGDFIDAVVPGESMDFSDKGAAKAMSVAYRIVLLQTLCIPTDDPDPDEHAYERAPRIVEPTAQQEARYDELAKQIAAAESPAGLKVGWEVLLGAYKADEITTQQANELKAAITARRVELEARGDSTGDGAGSGAVPGPTVAGAGPDSEGAENGGPGRDREEGSLRPGVQPGVPRGDGSGGAAQAPGDRRGASATAGGRRG